MAKKSKSHTLKTVRGKRVAYDIRIDKRNRVFAIRYDISKRGKLKDGKMYPVKRAKKNIHSIEARSSILKTKETIRKRQAQVKDIRELTKAWVIAETQSAVLVIEAKNPAQDDDSIIADALVSLKYPKGLRAIDIFYGEPVVVRQEPKKADFWYDRFGKRKRKGVLPVYR